MGGTTSNGSNNGRVCGENGRRSSQGGSHGGGPGGSRADNMFDMFN